MRDRKVYKAYIIVYNMGKTKNVRIKGIMEGACYMMALTLLILGVTKIFPWLFY